MSLLPAFSWHVYDQKLATDSLHYKLAFLPTDQVILLTINGHVCILHSNRRILHEHKNKSTNILRLGKFRYIFELNDVEK